MPKLRRRIHALTVAILICIAAAAPAGAAAATTAATATATKTVRYHGYRLTVPANWPVHRISASSTVCVRFNRHAVYLGKPGTNQVCPTDAIGQTEAILVQPLAGSGASAVESPRASGPLRAARVLDGGSGSKASFIDRTHGVLITTTWNHNTNVIERALGLKARTTLTAAARIRPHAAAAAHRLIGARSSAGVARVASTSGPASPGTVYAGLGFDTCTTQSTTKMAAWATSSPFGAVGVYIGGENAACNNLTAAWTVQESQAGWHLLPIFVGLQAPSNSCGCKAMSSTPSTALTQGETDARTAIADAQAVGLGAGNPIYDDMESYARGTTNTTSVLAFLDGWTTALHAAGYISGVYGSLASGAADLVSEFGTAGFPEPDEIWFAYWPSSGQPSIDNSAIPTADWPNGKRIQQYQGGHVESYGGQSIDIDSDAVDAATAAAGTTVAITGTPVVGQVLTAASAGTSGALTTTYQWERCNTSAGACVPIVGATASTYTLTTADPGSRLRVIETVTYSIGADPPLTSAASKTIAATANGYMLYTAFGNVYNTVWAPLYGSPSASGAHAKNIAGIATNAADSGYWAAARGGRVYAYGAAKVYPQIKPAHPIKGIVTAPNNGYWLYTAAGDVYSRGDPRYGSLAKDHLRDIVGMASTVNGKGYWLVTSLGTVFSFGKAGKYQQVRPSKPIAGIVGGRHGGYWLYTAEGNVYNVGTQSYGSLAGRHVTHVAGMAATPDGKGYWLITSSGKLYRFGDAGAYPVPSHVHPLTGMAGV